MAMEVLNTEYIPDVKHVDYPECRKNRGPLRHTSRRKCKRLANPTGPVCLFDNIFSLEAVASSVAPLHQHTFNGPSNTMPSQLSSYSYSQEKRRHYLRHAMLPQGFVENGLSCNSRWKRIFPQTCRVLQQDLRISSGPINPETQIHSSNVVMSGRGITSQGPRFSLSTAIMFGPSPVPRSKKLSSEFR